MDTSGLGAFYGGRMTSGTSQVVPTGGQYPLDPGNEGGGGRGFSDDNGNGAARGCVSFPGAPNLGGPPGSNDPGGGSSSGMMVGGGVQGPFPSTNGSLRGYPPEVFDGQ